MGNATQGTADRKQTATPAMDQVGPMQQSVGEQSPMNLSEQHIHHLARNHSSHSTRANPRTLTPQYPAKSQISPREQIPLSNYADGNVLYTFGSNLEEVKQNLSQDLLKLSGKCMNSNPEKLTASVVEKKRFRK